MVIFYIVIVFIQIDILFLLFKDEYEENSIEEIAEMMHLTEAAVRMKLSRARKRIRTVYTEQNKKEGGTYDHR